MAEPRDCPTKVRKVLVGNAFNVTDAIQLKEGTVCGNSPASDARGLASTMLRECAAARRTVLHQNDMRSDSHCHKCVDCD